MGWTGIKLDSTTMMIGAMVIGISVDDTIHFMHKFSSYYARTGDFAAAVHETLSTTGAAMLVTTLVLASASSPWDSAASATRARWACSRAPRASWPSSAT